MKQTKYHYLINSILFVLLISLPLISVEKPTANKADIFTDTWQSVNSLIDDGLTEAALDSVESIHKRAIKAGNADQVIKSLIFSFQLLSSKEEEALIKVISRLNSEIKESSFPVKPVLHSMLAECYWNYYQNNRWRIFDRTQTDSPVSEDIRTWDLRRIMEKVTSEYYLSLKDEESLRKTRIDIYDEIIKDRYPDIKLRPTLYDLLAHRALDFFFTDDHGLTKPSFEFTINSPDYFLPFDRYAKLDIKTEDTASLKFHAMLILQNLISFHIQDKSPEALVDVDLKRLAFVHMHSVLPFKDSLYLSALQSLEKRFPNSPASAEVTYQIASLKQQWGSSYIAGEDEQYRWMNKEALEECERAIKRWPDSYGAVQCKALASKIKTKSLGFNVESVNLPDKPFKALLSYRNVGKVYWRILEIDIDKYQSIKSHAYDDSITAKLAAIKPIMEWKTDLPLPPDYQSHSVEVQIPPLTLGHYAILCSSSPDFSINGQAVAFGSVQTSRMSHINRQKEGGGQEFHILDRQTGHPIQGVTVKAWKLKYDEKRRSYQKVLHGKYLSDKDGFVFIPPEDALRYTETSIELIKGDDRLHVNRQYSLYKFQTQKPKTRLSTFFFTDRKIYRPGQKIYFKGIVLRTDGERSEIAAGYTTSVRLNNVHGEEVSRLELTTNKYGSIHGSFVAPVNTLNGQMSIVDDHGYVGFSVEEYKRPGFEVRIDPFKGTNRLEEKIRVTGHAKAYAGSPVDGAIVKYRVVRTARFPDWWWCWRRPARWSRQIEISSGSTVTNDTGGFSIDFTAIADKSIPESENPIFSYNVSFDVTDINGETRSASGTVNVGYVSLTLNVDIGQQVSKESKLSFPINTENLNGTFEPVKGNIKIQRLEYPKTILRKRLWQKPDTTILTKARHDELFPEDIYKSEDDITAWPRGEVAFKGNFDTRNDKNLDLTDAKKWKPGVYVLEAEAEDRSGIKVKDTRYFTLYSEKGKVLPYPQTYWFVPVKSRCEPGDTAVFLAGTGYSDAKLLYEIEHRNQIVKKEWLDLNKMQTRLQIPVEEKHRGNLFIHVTFVHSGRTYNHTAAIEVPWTNKELDISFETFRSSLYPGEKEEWRLKVSGKGKDKVAAEMVTALYDASLDAFTPHNWNFSIYPHFSAGQKWRSHSTDQVEYARLCSRNWNLHSEYPRRSYPSLNWFGYQFREYIAYVARGYGGGLAAASPELEFEKSSSPAPAGLINERVLTKGLKRESFIGENVSDETHLSSEQRDTAHPEDLSGIKARINLNETAFFFPSLETNDRGEIIVKFQVPEALTRWKMLGFAHTQKLEYGLTSNELVTRKDLMVMPNPPRFFRENDRITFSAKVSNLSDDDLSGTAQLLLFDAASMKPVDNEFGNEKAKIPFSAKKGQSSPLQWDLKIPDGIGAVNVKVVASAGKFSDGEERIIPVLSNRTLVTESVPLSINRKGTKKFTIPVLLSQNDSSSTVVNHRLTLEFTSNPAWYAIEALPYLIEYPYECSEQIFSRFYANSLAAHIANSSPKIKSVFDRWKNESPDALLSNLEKNQELKSLLLEETPWLLDGKDESERKKRVGLLFDINRLAKEKEKTLARLKKLQLKNGGWPWFEGGPDDRYITQHIAIGLGRLDHLGVLQLRSNHGLKNMTTDFLMYLDERIREDYQEIMKYATPDSNNLSEIHIQYLYMRSFFKDMSMEKKNREAFEYFLGQAKKYWLKNRRYMQGMIALALNRYGDKVYPQKILTSLKQNAIVSEEMGMYWKEMYEMRSWWWYDAPIESQALMVEVFEELGNDPVSVDNLKTWLIKSKQTQNWKTTRATADACYALLLRGTDWLTNPSNVSISLGDIKINAKDGGGVKTEAGTGYFKKSWTSEDIKPQMGNITVTKQENGVSWGAVYWQYFEQMDKIKAAETPLKLKKNLFIETTGPTGKKLSQIDKSTILKPGDKIIVRIELRVDRDMEYVHMKDMRASGFEPLNVFSGYRWQGGLGYYESTRDAATNFFFSYLKKGTYVFEYPLVVTHAGDFSNGITTIQCMYAPEFTSHSEGIRVVVTGRK